MRWETFTSFFGKFIQETFYQILSESFEFYRRYCRKHFGLIFAAHTVLQVCEYHLTKCLSEFFQIWTWVQLGTKMDWLEFEVKRSKVKWTVRPSVSKWALWEFLKVIFSKVKVLDHSPSKTIKYTLSSTIHTCISELHNCQPEFLWNLVFVAAYYWHTWSPSFRRTCICVGLIYAYVNVIFFVCWQLALCKMSFNIVLYSGSLLAECISMSRSCCFSDFCSRRHSESS